MTDPTGQVIAELRADAAVTAIVGDRVRGAEPAEGDRPPMVVVTRMSSNRDPGGGGRLAGLQEVMLGVKCYGVTPIQSVQLYGACSDALHVRGPRVDASARAIFFSADDVGVSTGRDPGTDWPWTDGTIRVVASAGAIV